jgi:hypothetical protein
VIPRLLAFALGVFVVLAIIAAARADGPTANTGEVIQFWQAKRIVRANAAILQRPDFRITQVARVNGLTVKVCWSEPGYVEPDQGRDYGCDIVQKRGREWWLRDDSTGGGWLRWL